jgi:hypothetical protein
MVELRVDQGLVKVVAQCPDARVSMAADAGLDQFWPTAMQLVASRQERP